SAGNVAAEAIAHVVVCSGTPPAVVRVRNPLPAIGGIDPEAMALVKLLAHGTIRRGLERAITEEDYAELAGRRPGIQRAAASLRWNGSWYEVQVTLDPSGSEDAGGELLRATAIALDRYRRIGHDLDVLPARYVPLDLAVRVCVRPHYLRAHV